MALRWIEHPGIALLVDGAGDGTLATVLHLSPQPNGSGERYRLTGLVVGPMREFGSLEEAKGAAEKLARGRSDPTGGSQSV